MAELICAAHYFGDCGMANFWSTFSRADVRRDFEAIRVDGFSHVILIVPWAQFQPRLIDGELDPVCADRLRMLLRAAEQAGLRVILRLGYLWEVSPVRYLTFDRIKDLPVSRANQRAWETHFASMDRCVQNCPAFDFAFVSWEDWYWPILIRVGKAPLDARKTYAAASGFTAYLQMKYDWQALQERYGLEANDWQDLAIPQRHEPLFEEYVIFFDTILSERLFTAASTNFPGLEFEYRIDDEWLPSKNGLRLYSWARSRSGASRPLVYYHPHIGMKAKETVNGALAVDQLRDLTALFQHGRRSKKVFIDQLNFVVRNPSYPHFSSIEERDELEFLQGAETIIAERTSGYGVWGYRDWINDKIFNGRFECGLEGWEISGHVVPVRAADGSLALEMEAHAALKQKLYQDGLQDPKLIISGRAREGSGIRIAADDGAAVEIAVGGRFSRVLDLPAPVERHIEIGVTAGAVAVERIGVFSNVLTSGLYSRDRQPRPAVAAVREMNRRLLGLGAPSLEDVAREGNAGARGIDAARTEGPVAA